MEERNDRKFGAAFDAVARGADTRVIRTPILAPKANGYVERLIGTLRRECTDRMLIWGEPHLQGVLDEYRRFYNEARPPGNRTATTWRVDHLPTPSAPDERNRPRHALV